MKKSLQDYAAMSVNKAILKNALPAMAAMLMTLVYNLADTFFIGQTHDAYQVAAVSLATPVFLIFMAFGTVFGIGGTSVISRSVGDKNYDYAKKVCSFCMWGSVAVSLILFVILFLFMDPIVSLLGASEHTFEYTKIYLVIVTFSGPFALLSSCFSNILRAEGQATKAMTGMLLGNITNMVLDAVFIMVFHWDIVGCALATLIGETVGAIYYIIYYLRGQSDLGVSIRDFTLKEKIPSNVFAIGVPAALASILMSASSIIMNAMMSGYGDMAVAAVGVAMKINMITGMIVMGLGQGIQPLLGYCVGSNNRSRFKAYMKNSILLATGIATALTLLTFVFLSPIIKAFLTDTTAIEYALSFSKILLISGPFLGLFFMLVNALQAMGAGSQSLILSIARQGIIYIPSLFILNTVFGIDGLLFGQPVADILSILLGCYLYAKHPGVFQNRSKSSCVATSA